MSIRKIMFMALFAFSGVINTSYANVHLVLPATLGANACENLPGTWTGDGKAEASIFTCHYTGRADIAHGSESGQYLMNLFLKTDSYWPCHDASVMLPAMCQNGKVDILMSGVNLNGSIDGSQVNFNEGTVVLSGLTTKIDYIHLTKS